MLPPITIPRIDPPSDKDFKQKYLKAGVPVVITGLMNDWTALNTWTPDYFIEKYGSVEANTLSVNQGINTYEGQKLKPASISESGPKIKSGDTHRNVVIASPIDAFPAEIRDEYITPRYCAKGKFLTSHLFISAGQTVSPMHQDLPENLFAMIYGSKRITLFSPFDTVYPNSRFSRIPHFSQVDIEKPDCEKFPKLKDAQPYTVDLQAGEILFIPSFWWHHVRNLETTIALNFWWSQGWQVPIAAARDIYKMVRGL